ncbi:hypothetical protein MES5069_270173 [Mesorhizobium escarrei]|uniref:Uncharacterized protein n=1 Tax=Mesorhizobium escarrei TaxID=666018 RepID=A0ABN8JT47_9HYPH|nr:hypothetical protein MES5069_270173 [Mesorhizobium escarrei]
MARLSEQLVKIAYASRSPLAGRCVRIFGDAPISEQFGYPFDKTLSGAAETGFHFSQSRPSIRAQIISSPFMLVVVDRNAERFGGLDDQFRHLDVGARRRRVA